MTDLERDLALRLEAAARNPPAERPGEVLEALGSTVSKAFGLQPDELAILVLSRGRTVLRFVYPPELAEGGNMFPLTVPSLAGRAVQTGRSVLINAVHEVPHLGFYERIRIKESRPTGIQKLLAVAVKGSDGKAQAVIEISRRGESLAEAGPDFHPEDQQLLERLATVVGPAMAEAFAGSV
jgi:hypothetical protein